MPSYDSSRTRVAPVFNWLYCRDVSGATWLPQLLRLIGADDVAGFPFHRKLRQANWWPHEKALPAPLDLLRWLILNCQRPVTENAMGTGNNRERREALLQREQAMVEEAIAALARAPRGRVWYILEGPSKPDAYLATDELVVVVEGKRTEAAPTIHTDWMPERHQMLRHLDAAWDTLQGRRLVGLMIVEGLETVQGVPAPWCNYQAQLDSPEILFNSMPHRNAAERIAIRNCFKGITTWQSIIAALGIPETVLIPELAAGGI